MGFRHGHFTLDQAKWFRDIQKANGNTNNPDTYSYYAYYRTLSQTADAYGRYPCVMMESKQNQLIQM